MKNATYASHTGDVASDYRVLYTSTYQLKAIVELSVDPGNK